MNAAPTSATVANRVDPWKTWPVTIKRLQRESDGVFTIELDFDDAEVRQQYQYAPGQFNMLYVPGVGEVAVSIADKTTKGLLQHTIRTVGSVTQAIESGGVGMSLGLRGPFGRSWPLESIASSPETSDLIIVAGGIGLAPMRSLVNQVASDRDKYGEVHVLLGARTPADLLYAEQQRDWRSHNMVVDATVDRGPSNWRGHTGVVTLLLERLLISRPMSTIVMTCGPEVMMRYVARSAIGRGISEFNIWVTMERNMNCAIGLCGHCQLGPKFICKEGPVFRFDEVKAWLGVQEL